MTFDKVEIESVLNNGRRILSERPELAELSLDEVLNELDDGTPQARHDRWGVTARLVIKSITNFELTELISYLSQIESGILTYKYTGYLLLTECGVNLEELILKSEQFGQFEKIVPYVSSNLIFEAEVHSQYVQQILCMLENHMTNSAYHPFLKNYADHIAKLGAQSMVADILGGLSGQTQYNLLRNLCWSWYKRNSTEANEVIGKMLEYESIWSKKVAIDFLEASLNFDRAAFRKHFSELKYMLKTNEELWLMIIRVFTKFVLESKDEETLDQLYHQVLDYLNMIPSDSIDAKCSFMESIGWEEEIPDDLKSIFHGVISQPCSKNRKLLDLLDQILYVQFQKGDWKAALLVMLKAFSANQYNTDYRAFFDAMHFVNDQIPKYAAEVTIRALEYMLSCDVNRTFFGLGLLMNVGGLQDTENDKNSAGVCITDDISNTQMIKIMKAILYYGFDCQKTCTMAFQFLKFSQESNEKYVDFCIKGIYGNYPATMHKVAEQYRTSSIVTQVYLAETVIKAYECSCEEQKQSYNIKDLQPSREHQHIYRMAQLEENRRITKSANVRSVFANLCTKRTMKYGVRSAYVIERKDQKSYQVSPYQSFKYQVELPANYVNDPVSYEMQRRAYLSEVIQDATDN